jgi:5'-nucleotidase
MIKGYLDQETYDAIMSALRKAHNGKEVMWVDMDGVVADFEPKATAEAAKMQLTFKQFADQKQYRHIEGFYRDLPLIPGAKEAILELDACGKYEINFLSAPSWGNESCFTDKRIWIKENFGTDFDKRMDLSFHKGHYLGHYLIDDRTKYGAGDFIGEHLQFGNSEYPNWDSILKKLL